MKVSDKLAEQLNGWERYLSKFIETDDFDNIFRELKSRKSRNIKTAPESSDLWKAFTLCPPEKLKCIVVGLCPYHTFKGDMSVADGIALSCSKTGIVQPSLDNWFHALEDEYNDNQLDVDMVKEPNLSYLCEQGILMYNIALTTMKDKAGSDVLLWSKFTKYFFEEVINNYWSGIPIVTLGVEAGKIEQYLTPMRHYLFKISHPASAAYQNKPWSSEGVFRKIDKILFDNNKEKIEWYKKKDTWEEIIKRPSNSKPSLCKEWEEATKMPWD